MATNLTYITKLYNEEFHLLAHTDVKMFTDLANLTVNIDLRHCGTALTASAARLFHEHTTDAGNGRAALRRGATYDPGFLGPVHLPHAPDAAAQALSWYRRASDLGESEAELCIQELETKSGR
jgi:hypothetical protein